MTNYYDDLRTLGQQIPAPVLDVMKQVLEREVGADRARELLQAIDDRAWVQVALLPADSDETDRLTAQYLAQLKKALASLEGTNGLQWTKAYSRHYIVTLDGVLIGYVDPVGVHHSGDGRSRVINGWRPSLCASIDDPLPAQPTVQAAAVAVKNARAVPIRRATR